VRTLIVVTGQMQVVKAIRMTEVADEVVVADM
jgi:hypothetical protein